MDNPDTIEQPKIGPEPAYRQKIEAILSRYADGRNVLINAPDWDIPLRIKPEYEADIRDEERDWLYVAATLGEIIAKEKYGLDFYPIDIRKIDSEGMIYLYSTLGMPTGEDHWSRGKELLQTKQSYERGLRGLAYEIVINSNRCIAYCMDTNSKAMHALVIMHAALGHNSFFKRNYLFKQHTQPDEIIIRANSFTKFVKSCEERYGEDRVERLLDAANALASHAINKYTKPPPLTPDEEKARRIKLEEERRLAVNDLFDRTTGPLDEHFRQKARGEDDAPFLPPEPEENILGFIATYAPHLEEWERQILREICYIRQYFYPQGQTKVMNEGCATFWHLQLLNDLYDEGLISQGMMMEAIHSHSGVVYQPPAVIGKNPNTGEPVFNKRYNGINPYALGYAMFTDIKRICTQPTEEDIKWFPKIAGSGDWVKALDEAVINFKDDSFIRQYLSPKLIRNFRFFEILDEEDKPFVEISDIHNEEGYENIRKHLAEQNCMVDHMPVIEVEKYDYRGDRSLVLRHTVLNNQLLEPEDTQNVLELLGYLWKHPVYLYGVNENDQVVEEYEFEPDYIFNKPEHTL